jgi:hypothetical protein
LLSPRRTRKATNDSNRGCATARPHNILTNQQPGRIVMPKFQVQIGRTSRVYHTATIEADSLEDLQNMRARDIVDLSDEWKEDGRDDPEFLETVNVSDETGHNHLARWNDQDGWGE